MSDVETENQRSVLERHIQTAIQVLAVALLMWAGKALLDLSQTVAVLEERITAQGATLIDMRSDMRDMSDTYYRRTEAQRDLDAIEQRIGRLDGRVSQLEGDR